jgi:hypothetical protein
MRYLLAVLCLLCVGGVASAAWQATRVVPVSPVAVDLTKLTTGELGLPDGTKIEAKHCLINTAVFTQLYQYDASGNITYLVGGLTTSRSAIYKVEDWVSYCCVRYQNVPVRVGVGVRCQSVLTTRESKLDLAGIFNLTLGASTKKVTGASEVHVLGLSGAVISAFSPQGGTITPESIQATEKATAVIMSKVWDATTIKIPVVLGQEVPVEEIGTTAFRAKWASPGTFRGEQAVVQ